MLTSDASRNHDFLQGSGAPILTSRTKDIAMKRIDPKNERLKLDYQDYLRHVDGLDHKTIDKVMTAIRQFETSTNCKPFLRFNKDQAIAFKDWLDTARNSRTGKPLSKATIGTTLRAVREFFRWAAGQKGYKSAIGRNDWVYFKQPRKDARAAQTSTPRQVPSVAQVEKAFEAMPFASSLQKRDRALVAMLMLTGARIGAAASLRLKHVDLERRHVFQDAREVNTKAAKTMNTTFFPMGGQFIDALSDYITHLTQDLMFGPEGALFPKAHVVRGPNGFQVAGLSRRPFASTGPLNEIVKDVFAAVQLPRYTPHSFRHMLALHGDELCPTREKFKAWSQNMGHTNPLTTVSSYMPVSADAQREIILGLGEED
jgi:integrase/recombinase XerC